MSRFRANLLLVLAALIWGVGNVAHKTVLDHLDALSVVGLTCLIGGLLALPFVQREKLRPPTVGWQRSAARVTILFAASITAQQVSFASTSVTNASFLISTYTVMTPFCAWLLLRERPGLTLCVAALLVLLGSILLSGGVEAPDSAGDMLSLVTALLFALWTIELGRHMQEHGRPFTTMALQMLATALAVLPWCVLKGSLSLVGIIAAWPELVLLGVFSMSIAYGLQTLAQQHTSATHASVITSAECVVAAIAAAIILGEQISAQGAVGAVLVGVAVMLAATSGTEPQAASVPA